ncbi:hypothetical protein [Actinoplanes sp. NPDC026619]|uniref:hypothetical protein n=1 Tax=Actinoplanes sp. NPDC026619 TaxID=3155798 RepID=UPI0033FEA63E
MTTLRAAAAAAALVLLLGGCSKDTNNAEVVSIASSGPPAEAMDALVAAATVLQTGNYTFVVASPAFTAEGFVHLPSESAKVTIDAHDEKFEIVLAEPDRWVRSSAGIVPGAGADTWFHVDSSEIQEGGDLDLELTDPDVVGLDALFAAVTDAQGDAKTVTGTIDGGKVQSPNGFLDNATIKAMGKAASALPFTANLDSKGRLAELDIDAPAAGDALAGRWVFTVSGYDEQKPQTKPAGRIEDLPASAYAKLNG